MITLMSIFFSWVLLNLFLLLAGMEDMLTNNKQSTIQFYFFCSLCSKMKFNMLVHILYAVHHLETKCSLAFGTFNADDEILCLIHIHNMQMVPIGHSVWLQTFTPIVVHVTSGRSLD